MELPYKPNQLELPYKPNQLELPDDVLQIIKQYARPITNPRWRHLRIMTHEQFYKQLFPHRIISFRENETVIHVICIRNIQMKIIVQKKEMQIMIEPTGLEI